MSHGIFGSGVAPLPDTSQLLSPRGRAATLGRRFFADASEPPRRRSKLCSNCETTHGAVW